MTETQVRHGDVEIAAVGSVLADQARCRMLLALNDGRSLPASVLADEADVSRSTASSHLSKLLEAGLLQMEQHGRHRYYRLSGPLVGDLLEAMMRLGPTRPVRSLREGNRAAQLRTARTCYDHLAGRLGVGVMGAMIERGHLVGGDGTYDPDRAVQDTPTGYGHDLDYEVTEPGWEFLTGLGVDLPSGNRRLVRYCIDWSEQRHHLGGRLGRGVLDLFLAKGWVRRRDNNRSVAITEAGTEALEQHFGLAAA
jgi:DNA-binding transcriptional ArsR family regulator